MKILHISNKPVYPKVDGGCAAMASMLDCLRLAENEVHHICISTEKHPFSAANYPADIYLPFSAEDSFISTKITAAGALLSILKRKNYNLSRFFSKTFALRLKELLKKEQYDAVILDSTFLIGYIDTIKAVGPSKVIVRAHNAEFRLWEQQAASASGLKKLYLLDLARTLKNEELQGLSKSDKIWTISAEDAEELKNAGISADIETIPFALAVLQNKSDYSCADFMHFGSMNWQPNKESLEYLKNEIWPEVAADIKLHVAGSFISEPEYSMENIINHGFVEDPQAFLQSHGTLLAPLRSGSGIRIKLLEAMAAGVPCVTTRLGAAGIDEPEKHLQLAETKAEWLKIIEKLYKSQEERKDTGQKGQAYIRKSHSFEAVIEKIKHSLGQ